MESVQDNLCASGVSWQNTFCGSVTMWGFKGLLFSVCQDLKVLRVRRKMLDWHKHYLVFLQIPLYSRQLPMHI